MSRPNPLLHVGYHKTGTSWLQQFVFDNPGAGFEAAGNGGAAIDEFVTVNPFRYDPGTAHARFADSLREAHERGLVPVISHEDLSGHPIWGRYYGKEVAERLRACFPEARVFIGIREQRAMLMSLYSEQIHEHGHLSLSEFLATDGVAPGFAATCRLDHLEYDLLIEHYFRLFGKENVLVLPHEMMCADAPGFLGKLAEFCGLPEISRIPARRVNASYSPVTLALKRRVNAFVPWNPNGPSQPWPRVLCTNLFWHFNRISPAFVDRWLRKRTKLRIREFVGGYFAESNRRTVSLTGIDLGHFGYDMG